jgi:hypothetical protein
LLHHCCFFCEAVALTDPKEGEERIRLHAFCYLICGHSYYKLRFLTVNALRIIARKMAYTKWNFSVDPCSRNPSWYIQNDRDGELGVICNCVYNKNTTCHVLKL